MGRRVRANKWNLVYRNKRRLRRFRAPVIWLKHRGLGPEDVLLASYPKSGNTWLKFILAQALSIAPISWQDGRRIIPYVGEEGRAPRLLPGGGRLVKTHEPYRREYRRAIYIVRDVHDVIISYYNRPKQQRAGAHLEFKAFLRRFLDGGLDAYGAWHAHAASWLDAPIRPHLVRYEELRRDTEAVVGRILEFLQTPLPPEDVRSAIEDNTFEKMRAKEDLFREGLAQRHLREARLMRGGRVGDWRTWMDAEDLALIERRAGEILRRLGYAREPVTQAR